MLHVGPYKGQKNIYSPYPYIRSQFVTHLSMTICHTQILSDLIHVLKYLMNIMKVCMLKGLYV